MREAMICWLAAAFAVASATPPALGGDGAPVLCADAATLELDEGCAREVIFTQLVLLDRDPVAAMEAAAALTMDDLEVLLANPAMMQEAAGIDVVWIAVIVGALIIAGLVILAANGSGFVMIS